MKWETPRDHFVTNGRLELARNYASDIAEREPWSNAYSCAEKAVRRVFGRWLLDHSAMVRPRHLGLYYRLIGQVESRLGLHRRTGNGAVPTPSGHAQKPFVFTAEDRTCDSGFRAAC